VNVRAMPLASALMSCVLPLSAQDAAPSTDVDSMPFHVVARWDSSRYLGGRTTLTFDLARPLLPGERLAVLIGSSDVSGAVRIRGRRADYEPAALRLPSGTTDAVVYVVGRDGEWREAGRATLRVRTRAGLDRNAATPSVDLATSGQFGQHVPGGAPEPPRRTWQDLTLRLGLAGLGARGGWETSFQSNAVGVSEKTQRLRWSERQERAPALDLTDYRLQMHRGPVRVSVGNLSVGANRYLLSGFASRGVTASAQLRRGIAIEAAALNGTNVVGWDNLLGVSNGDHRMLTAGVDLELAPSRPGAFEVDIQALDGSLLPRTGYTQGAVTDAERSRGYGVQLRLSDASQRVRLTGGITRSRFRNPIDPLLQGDTTLVPVRAETRAARSGELGIDLLRELRLFRSTLVSLGATARHERIDPLYRSVGAFVQGDMQQNTAELNGTVGALALQAVIARGRDNLANIPSILTTHTTRRTLSFAAPIHGLLGTTARAWLPLATFRWEGTIQAGDAVPVNGDFAATHVPDQYNRLRAASFSWSPDGLHIAYRWDESLQDNRQAGRERADLRARVHGLSIALNGNPRLTPAVEASVERQDILETAQQQRTSRVGAAIQAQLTRTMAFSGTLTHTWSFDPFGERRTRNLEFQSELSQGFTLYRPVDGGTQGRMFLRYARTRAVFSPFTPDALVMPQLMWTVNGGTSIRFF
jgi:hypothetical protein